MKDEGGKEDKTCFILPPSDFSLIYPIDPSIWS